MATQVTLNSGSVDSAGSLALKTNGTTTAVTIDTSQNVGIGTVSPARKFEVIAAGAPAAQFVRTTTATNSLQTNPIVITRTSGNMADGFGTLVNHQIQDDAGVDNTIGYYGFVRNGADNSGAFYVATSNAGTASERMRIDSSGNVGIGTSSPAVKLHVSGQSRVADSSNASNYMSFGVGANASYGNASISTTTAGLSIVAEGAGDMTFLNNGSERARIDSSGNLLIGSTSGSLDGFGEKLFVSQNSANAAFIASNTSASCISPAIIGVTADRNTTNNTFYPISYYNRGAANYKFRVADSGNVTNTNNSYGQISDIKLKENIVDATQKLEKLNQVRVVNFNFIGDQQKQLGVIAQELEQVFPSMVEESVDRDEEGNDLGTTTKSVKYSVFVPMLIKAIQEQQAIITQLQADVAALKGASA